MVNDISLIICLTTNANQVSSMFHSAKSFSIRFPSAHISYVMLACLSSLSPTEQVHCAIKFVS